MKQWIILCHSTCVCLRSVSPEADAGGGHCAQDLLEEHPQGKPRRVRKQECSFRWSLHWVCFCRELGSTNCKQNLFAFRLGTKAFITPPHPHSSLVSHWLWAGLRWEGREERGVYGGVSTEFWFQALLVQRLCSSKGNPLGLQVEAIPRSTHSC